MLLDDRGVALFCFAEFPSIPSKFSIDGERTGWRQALVDRVISGHHILFLGLRVRRVDCRATPEPETLCHVHSVYKYVGSFVVRSIQQDDKVRVFLRASDMEM